MASGKVRLDQLLVDRQIAETRSKAQAMIMSGMVVVGDHQAQKAGQLVSEEAEVRLKGEQCPYVSRGGLKLEAALDAFGVDPQGLVCIDVGASTGGFTDCLIMRGAKKVFAVDVGYGQLAWKLQQDSRVVNIERCNIRFLTPEQLGERCDLAVIDASFISLDLILPEVSKLVKEKGEVIALVKPQFEVGRGQIDKGGVVKDEAARKKALEKVCDNARLLGFGVLGEILSPIKGAKKGNTEYLIHLSKTA
ncbi:TlyA family RNA methyltransferase [bacterium]|nr:MAG: TlyA family RNA methyltransferase [bacterium]